MTDLWTEASRDYDAEAAQRALLTAKTASMPFWPFLAAASDQGDFDTRLALSEDRILSVASAYGVEPVTLAQEFQRDWRVLAAQKKLADKAFYVTDGGEKVGGPYDSKADAQDAIDGGEVSGDDLKVSGGGDSDDDSGSDDDSKDDDSDKDDSSSDSDDDGGNPFAKKDATRHRADLLAGIEGEDEDKDGEEGGGIKPSMLAMAMRCRVNGVPYVFTGQRVDQSMVRAAAYHGSPTRVIMPDGRLFMPASQASLALLQRLALEEGQDPLAWIAEMGGGTGTPEVADEHSTGPSVGVAPESNPNLGQRGPNNDGSWMSSNPISGEGWADAPVGPAQ